MSEITQRAEELRAIAKDCETRAQFRRKFPTWNMESVNYAIDTLGLKFKRDSSKSGPPKAAQACPKPVSGKAKA